MAKFVPYKEDHSKQHPKISRDVAKKWLQKIAHEEVESFQHDKAGTKRNYGRFNRSDVRKIRQRVIHRVMRDGGERYGFVTVGWLLMVAVASCISWAIKRWLDKRFPDKLLPNLDNHFTTMLDELSKE